MARQDFLIGAAAGLAVAALVPLALLLTVGKQRPLARALARGGQLFSDKTRETLAECQEIVEDFVAEMRVSSESSPAQSQSSPASVSGAAAPDSQPPA